MSEPLLDALFSSGPHLGRETIDAILARPDLAPGLKAILQDPESWDAAEPDGWAPVHAVLLLGSMKPPGAFEILVRALDLAEQHGVGPIINEAAGLLASFGLNHLPALRAAASDHSRSPIVRSAALDALTLLAMRHDEIATDTAEHFRRIAGDREDAVEVRENAAVELMNFAERRDRTVIKDLLGEVFDAETIDLAIKGETPWTIDTDRSILAFYDEPAPDLRFDPDDEELDDDVFEDDDELPDDLDEQVAEYDEPKGAQELFGPGGPQLSTVERNAPCPCGSGLKFKKCCGK
jgi:hypothetical protein